MIRGRCECGSIRYEVTGAVHDFCHCHCSQCRRLHGAPYVSFAGVNEAQVEWTSGFDALKAYASSTKNDRYFCPQCGAQIMVISQEEPGVVYLTMGCVEGAPELPPGYHQYVDSKAPWLEICDDQPQYSGSVDE